MQQANVDAASNVSEADTLAVASLFKRIAQRGRKLRTGNPARPMDESLSTARKLRQEDDKSKETPAAKESPS